MAMFMCLWFTLLNFRSFLPPVSPTCSREENNPHNTISFKSSSYLASSPSPRHLSTHQRLPPPILPLPCPPRGDFLGGKLAVVFPPPPQRFWVLGRATTLFSQGWIFAPPFSSSPFPRPFSTREIFPTLAVDFTPLFLCEEILSFLRLFGFAVSMPFFSFSV